jgi:alkyldihydroxyacetonephosphate synthase
MSELTVDPQQQHSANAASWNGWGDPAKRPGITAPVRAFLDGTFGGYLTRPPAPVALQDIELAPPALPEGLRSRLEALAIVNDDPEARVAHARGKSYRDLIRIRSGDASGAPDAVVLPPSADQIPEILALCSKAGVAVVPFGGGTSVVGGVEPLRGRFTALIALDLRRLDRLVNLDVISHTATLQPGLRGPQAESLLNARGYTLGHFPQSYELATIGGYAATRSAGQASSGYGRSDEMVVGLTVATPAGTLRLGRAPRSAAGPDLRQLFLGSEGAFGVITDVTLSVRPVPAHKRYEAWFFPTFAAGLTAVRELEQQRLAPEVTRLSDEDETEANLALSGHGGGIGGLYLKVRRARAMAIFGWEGEKELVSARRKLGLKIVRDAGGVAAGTGAGNSWEHGRFGAPYLRDDLLDTGLLVETLETAGSWQQLPALRSAIRAALTGALSPDPSRTDGSRPVLVGCHVSHLYPSGASLYFTVLTPADVRDPVGQWDAAKRAATDAIVAEGATVTHHHAVGSDHAPWLPDEIGDLGVDVLRAIKAKLDPAGILNPGKLLP